MKRPFVASLALALSACATTPGASPLTADTLEAAIPTGERGFAAAELAYITAARGVGRLMDAGLISGEMAVTVRGWNADARRLLVRGKATAGAAEKVRVAALLFGIADRLNALSGEN